ncbi:hypothetical protein L1987_83640 [Smallanthus sonchifolius]|uniref:Uncharacterized protein n=1 Tax=Smallanthus sonchifolius TaxID=185202 RepID=A0ACB8YDP0_9ASTR|nr:hypothetical protein L1987_83640 [Smallanthus sonchifolius]
MPYVVRSRFSLHMYITILIIFQFVCNTYGESNGTGNISFDIFGPSPRYPEGGVFGTGSIELGGLEVYEAFYFKKIWGNENYGGPNDLGASVYEPSDIPTGFNLLGHYCKPNSIDMIAAVLTAKDTTGDPTHGSLKSPIDYTLIWTSNGQEIQQLEDPKNRELSVPTGTFVAQNDSSAHELVCLKMVRSDPYVAMPNSLQIKSMIKTYAPWVYFHPDEQYYPSSVLWFFKNGAELYKNGQVPVYVLKNGDNLPNTGGLDDAYLDLPTDDAKKETVKKGFLPKALAYIHVKPALGGTFTDLAIWLYYPFNGGGRFQLGPFTIDLGIIGEHVSDWEHITLRIDNYRGYLKAIYLSQHAKGKWLRPREFELVSGTRPVVYASLHGHSHYSTPTYHIHSKRKLNSRDMQMLQDEFETMNSSSKSTFTKGRKFVGFGVLDDASKSNNVMDIASSYNVVWVDHMDSGRMDPGTQLPWLNYTGTWGPKIAYAFTKEILKIADKLPDKVKELAIKVLHKLPAELLGEEGPEGPKTKENWSGDERI